MTNSPIFYIFVNRCRETSLFFDIFMRRIDKIDSFSLFCQSSQYFCSKTLTRLTDFRILVNSVNADIKCPCFRLGIPWLFDKNALMARICQYPKTEESFYGFAVNSLAVPLDNAQNSGYANIAYEGVVSTFV